MGIVSKDLFATKITSGTEKGHHLLRSVYSAFGSNDIRAVLAGGVYGRPTDIAINREDALRVYEMMRGFILNNGFLGGKYLRPWDVDENLYSRLDRSQTWWGFEFETGYKTRVDRTAILGEVWDTLDNTCFDSEGEGQAQVEITFAPEELSKYRDGSAQALKFMDILDRNPQRIYNGRTEAVGTHINISHPKLDARNLHWVSYCMARTLASLPHTVRYEGKDQNTRMFMFGRRHLYGGFFPQYTDNAVWIEGKLFRTVYSRKEFDTYIKVCEGLTKCLEFFCEHAPAGQIDLIKEGCLYVNNLFDVVFHGADLVVNPSAYVGNLDGSRAGNAINGMLAEDDPNLQQTIKELSRQRSSKFVNIWDIVPIEAIAARDVPNF